jgi:hypothetical protein
LLEGVAEAPRQSAVLERLAIIAFAAQPFACVVDAPPDGLGELL